ncbi:MAG: hypothetical protein COT92_01260 [Candidatus Doudnabacteria bacterium CG10_big_fil_rev_8_21_14_0_10_42_18]|uniref:Uncharacterized protein n=1 Tax=Candidatus Doudnabacteria bacterium CG10_big_fil_rev_8_21_14_0_10_42_18 TaxID=1974552 RepID=A0A2H0VBD9_9BACT|nr:MAG: hypothetical protein COT92_01260 [Candidatus Doudnabacteria bacterium CG10_big_fil_rev_8_21_14_0_10_42_18]
MDTELKTQLSNIETFLQKQMVTKDEFGEFKQEVNNRFDKLESAVNNLTISVEKFAAMVKKYQDEHETMKHQLMAVQD